MTHNMGHCLDSFQLAVMLVSGAQRRVFSLSEEQLRKELMVLSKPHHKHDVANSVVCHSMMPWSGKCLDIVTDFMHRDMFLVRIRSVAWTSRWRPSGSAGCRLPSPTSTTVKSSIGPEARQMVLLDATRRATPASCHHVGLKFGSLLSTAWALMPRAKKEAQGLPRFASSTNIGPASRP